MTRSGKTRWAGGVSPSRREFMKRLGAGAAAAGAVGITGLPQAAAAVPPPFLGPGGPAAPGFWNRVRAAFVLDPTVTYMNIGTTGSMPRHVLAAYAENNRAVAVNPLETLGGSTAMRAELAPQYGCNTDELVISNNTTDGVTMTLNGLALGAGDEIVTTNHEHPSGTAPMALLRDRRGVVIKEVHLPVGDADGPEQTLEHYVDLFRQQITPATKLFVFSAPTYLTGTMLPVRALADLAIEHGIHTLVDGAHATGMFNLDFHALGVDFFAGSGHKWQCGPGGSGFWYIRNQQVSNPLPLAPFYPTRTLLYDLTPAFPWNPAPADGETYGDPGFMNQLHGNPNYPAYRALADSAEFWSAIGRQNIEDYVLGLSQYLKDLLIARFGMETLYSPLDPRLQSALTAFTPFPEDRKNRALSDSFVTRLREEYGFVVRNTTVHIPGEADDLAIRVSTHLFHDRTDVAQVVAAMVDLRERMLAGA